MTINDLPIISLINLIRNLGLKAYRSALLSCILLICIVVIPQSSLLGQCPTSCDAVSIVTPGTTASNQQVSAGCVTVMPDAGIECAGYLIDASSNPAIESVTFSGGNGSACNGNVQRIFLLNEGTCSQLR